MTESLNPAGNTPSADPLRIAEVAAPRGGTIGLTLCPGKVGPGRHHPWRRDLDADVATVAAWDAGFVVTLMEAAELAAYGVPTIGERVRARLGPDAWLHLPIVDCTVPTDQRESSWSTAAPDLHDHLDAGGRVLVHCLGGLGRTGIVASRLLVERGLAPADALDRVRRARPGAVETRAQERWVLTGCGVRGGAAPAVEAVRPQERTDTGESAGEADIAARNGARGCLLGGAIGDALGAPVEFMKRAQIRHRFGDRGITDYAESYGGIGRITDDTQMTLFTAEGLLRAWVRGCSRGITTYTGVTANAYRRWLVTQEGGVATLDPSLDDGWLVHQAALHARRAPGKTCLSALRSSCGEQPARNDSKGCGGVMRMAPVGLFAAKTGHLMPVDEAFDLGCELAALTHGHPTGQLSAGVLAATIRELALGADLPAALATAAVCLRERERHRETLAALEHANELAEAGPPSADAVARLGEGWVAEEALAIAVYCARVASDFREGVCLAVNHDGDSDSTGALTGNLLGAMWGVDAIPDAWLRSLELREVITRIADDLVEFRDWPVGEYQPATPETWRIVARYPPV